ncbi:MAG: urea transporter, partial [Alistipes sp.]|nr:urea transporter [Alistipes sp.]
ALWALVGSALSMGMAVVMGMPVEHIDQGLYSFSAVLTAIALASVFYKPSWRSAMWATLGILVTVVVQAAMNVWVQPFGVATLTAPFCITTWLFLLPLLKFDEQHPDHSQWHHRS